jgi:hypothetical protein
MRIAGERKPTAPRVFIGESPLVLRRLYTRVFEPPWSLEKALELARALIITVSAIGH